MEALVTTLIWFGSVGSYIFIAATAGTLTRAFMNNRNMGQHGDRWFWSGLIGTLWPGGFFLIAGLAFGRWLTRTGARKEEKARQKMKAQRLKAEEADREHARAMERAAAEKAANELALQILEAEGIKARVSDG